MDFASFDPFVVSNNIIFDENYNGRISRRPRVMKERVPYFDLLDEVDFSKRFRLSKSGATTVLGLIQEKLEFTTNKNDAVPPMNQLLLGLRYYATGCTQLAAADFTGVSEASACRIVHRVSDALASMYPNFVYMPRNHTELRQTQRKFYEIARFPSVVGAVDCTHVKIRSPGGEHAEYYKNRKGYFSLNVQGVCNADLEFTNVVARWPGSTHDQTIFDHSRVRAQMETNRFGDSHLLGDSAYANRSYMMTPLDRPSTQAEELYNESQIRSRNPIERIFGVYKRRFPVAAVGINVRLEKVPAIIIATTVLYNILRRVGDPQPLDDPTVPLPLPWDQLLSNGNLNAPPPTTQRAPHRQLIIDNYFTRLLRE